jgi:hypothetical protein
LTARHDARTPTLAGVLALCLTGILLGGCESPGPHAGTPTGTSTPATATSGQGASPSATAPSLPGAPGPAPTIADQVRLVVHSAADPTSVTADVPPRPGGYVVAARCTGAANTSVTWVLTRAVGPVGEPAMGTAPCDGAQHVGTALPAGTVAVRVRLQVDVDLSSVSSAEAVLQPAG